jgi:hypothetical protein
MPSLAAPQLQFASGPPDRMIMVVQELEGDEARYIAIEAVAHARLLMPRVTGSTANRLTPVYGEGYFGIYFPDSWTWFMEHGTQPFTMRSLAGKTIPMWINDWDGSVRRKNPKAKVRTTEDGRVQVQIFRRAAKIGQRKIIKKLNRRTKQIESVSVPASYPGAPGRIARRVAPAPWTPGGQRGGQISAGNVGVRWRHPGTRAMQFMNTAMATAIFEAGFLIQPIYAADGASWEALLERRRQLVPDTP